MGTLHRLFLFTSALAVTYLVWTFGSRALRTRQWTREHAQSATASEFERIYGGKDVKILQFYAREGDVTEGTKALICYGVLNAKSVSIEPPVSGVSPSLNRCVEVEPKGQTRYTLTAEGNDGQVVSESFTLGVHADPDTLPRIGSFEIARRERDYSGKWVYLIRFSAQNPEEVSIDPPAFPTLHRSPYGSLYIAPEKTTTYTLTVTGKFGHKAQKQLIVEVPPK